MTGILTYRITWIGIFICLFSINVHSAWGFAEEPLYFQDPFTGAAGIEKVSSVHTELARALALAAGFSNADAATISIFNQLTDSMRFSSPPAGVIYYTNCLGVFPADPNPYDRAICPSGRGQGAVLFPLYPNSVYTNGRPCTFARPGVFGPFFHFPRTDNGELENARKWAWGEAKVLKGYAAYSWGTPGEEAIDGVCHYQMPMNIETGLQPGSARGLRHLPAHARRFDPPSPVHCGYPQNVRDRAGTFRLAHPQPQPRAEIVLLRLEQPVQLR